MSKKWLLGMWQWWKSIPKLKCFIELVSSISKHLWMLVYIQWPHLSWINKWVKYFCLVHIPTIRPTLLDLPLHQRSWDRNWSYLGNLCIIFWKSLNWLFQNSIFAITISAKLKFLSYNTHTFDLLTFFKVHWY